MLLTRREKLIKKVKFFNVLKCWNANPVDAADKEEKGNTDADGDDDGDNDDLNLLRMSIG